MDVGIPIEISLDDDTDPGLAPHMQPTVPLRRPTSMGVVIGLSALMFCFTASIAFAIVSVLMG